MGQGKDLLHVEEDALSFGAVRLAAPYFQPRSGSGSRPSVDRMRKEAVKEKGHEARLRIVNFQCMCTY